MTPTPTAILDEIIELDGRATPKPWEDAIDGDDHLAIFAKSATYPICDLGTINADAWDLDIIITLKNDAALIALSRNHAADLAREVKALRVAAGDVPIMAELEAEYCRQINDEGYDPDHDDTHREGELACAAVAYAMPEWLNEWMDKNDIKIWPFEGHPKFKDRRRDLIRAGALLIAEIARLDREVARPLLPAEPAGSE